MGGDGPVFDDHNVQVGLNCSTSPPRLELRLDGRRVVSFDSGGGTANPAWTVAGANSARLRFLTTRIGMFDERGASRRQRPQPTTEGGDTYGVPTTPDTPVEARSG